MVSILVGVCLFMIKETGWLGIKDKGDYDVE
jgi:hypothetical protein